MIQAPTHTRKEDNCKIIACDNKIKFHHHTISKVAGYCCSIYLLCSSLSISIFWWEIWKTYWLLHLFILNYNATNSKVSKFHPLSMLIPHSYYCPFNINDDNNSLLLWWFRTEQQLDTKLCLISNNLNWRYWSIKMTRKKRPIK